MSFQGCPNVIWRITPSHILVFFLLSSAVHAQSSSAPEASPGASLRNRNALFAPVVVALCCAFLFIACFVIYILHCPDLELPAGDPTDAATANCSSSVHHSIDPKLIEIFPILVYSAVKHLDFGKASAPECAVCLNEFDHRDTLRLLPKCHHVFHLECIDASLASHVTCPVCRSRLKQEEDHRRGEGDEVIVIPNEVTNAQQVFDESSVTRMELNSGNRSLGMCHSTGHSLGLGESEIEEERHGEVQSEDVGRCEQTDSDESQRNAMVGELKCVRRKAR
ncbi:E3 ubiquitin-protein ligase ATL6-like [Prosopis cineraria]|uniref:E3 ubiquitin-protein ligase ATL6-like n=1 Tax=Prosopis cineraria TaxID=364024 RepID=UPI00241046FC|nr:E3 ubiquitin-protein ligase ATL6-like [Prosopis cineraria]